MPRKHHENTVLRLSDREREILKILTAALRVSEYTDDVDGARGYRREDKMKDSMTELFTNLTGLSLIANELPPAVKEQLGQREIPFSALEPILGPAFEIGRRYKRFNPDKIRHEYGKLVMLLQDASKSRMRADLGMTMVIPCQTVGSTLAQIGASDLLDDTALLNHAIMQLPKNYTPQDAQRKAEAHEALVAKYAGGGADAADHKVKVKRELIDRCILSLSDQQTFVLMNRAPIKRMIEWLNTLFVEPDSKYSLAIRSGKNGSQLTHDHSSQRQYVTEALTLWGIIHRDIFDFWECAENDLIAHNGDYRYCDTGQGFHRMASAPSTYSRMGAALSEARQAMGGQWVGSTIVHLGDRDVPNSLVFIDKYTIIPRLLSPIVQTIDNIEEMFTRAEEPHPGIRKLILGDKFSSYQELQMTILADFFKHGFDGSGDDGGSCIDGRLTSAWNWCHKLHKKSFYDAFVLTGFTGFDANYN